MGVSFMNDFFNDSSQPLERDIVIGGGSNAGGPRIMHKIRNGQAWLWHCQTTDTYWRSLKSCKRLSPMSQRVSNPKNI